MAAVFFLLAVAFAIALVVVLVELQKAQARFEPYREIGKLERHKKRLRAEAEKYRGESIDLQKRAKSLRRQLTLVAQDLQGRVDGLRSELSLVATVPELQQRADELRNELSLLAAVQKLQGRVDELRSEVGELEETKELHEFGFYAYRYELDTSAEYKWRLDEVRCSQKKMLREKEAFVGGIGWTVDGSEAKGRKMVEEQGKLMLRAFNGECDAALAKVKYNNVARLESRITSSFKAINRLGRSKHVEISEDYFALKVDELRLAHEYQEKLQWEKEEKGRIQQQMRDEERARKEIEKAKKAAEDEEKRYADALEKARRDLEESTGEKQAEQAELIAKLEQQLQEALKRKERAISRAQLTRSGHVYVISNIGSFGDKVFKIGMTRRLEPLDRVYELGDASVPFRFDVHAMIYSEDAPALEAALHRELSDRRVNLVNLRREFFFATLAEIKEAAAKHHSDVSFVEDVEAEEYRKSVAMRKQTHAPAAVVAAVA